MKKKELKFLRELQIGVCTIILGLFALMLTGCNTINSKIAGDFSSPCNILGNYFQSFRYSSGDNYKDRQLIMDDLNNCILRLNSNMDALNMNGRFNTIKVVEGSSK